MFVYSLDGLEIDGDIPPDQEIEENEITARAAVYQVFAGIFSVPGETSHKDAVEGKWPEKLREASELLAFDFDFGVAALAPSVSQQDFEAEYLRLFEVGSGTDGPAAPICGGFYDDGDRRKRMEEVVRFFEYFGLKASTSETRPPDHLATELEFMQYLAFKEAASPSPRLSASYHRAQEDFLDRQMANWLPALAKRVEESNGLPVWVWATQTASNFVTADLAYVRS
jgi:DMSO reductase family type II enzyme chaperone